ncbi:MAG: malto-oligosyltrehalose synthase [Thiohalocapsa sp.]|uniref:malto-oligosyltrehalose synthase n=1 Tax=Thiohalocapsa sp. TaxID=2497641 RepID=UPI0025EAAA4B|nr:malto-oligosyltrehalose synthase [Thiohalocapsa sp.]MCG6942333.1 malto-oligosyltrehalose synthase [Thiohalocapsa sp.]
MQESDALDRLCEHFGIAARYQDVFGQVHRVDDATRRSLLRALGVAAGDTGTERASLAAAIDHDWARRLPPVLVHRQGDPPPRLPLALPQDLHGQAGTDTVRLVLTAEDGRSTETTIDLGAVPAAATRELHGTPWLRRQLPITPPERLGYHRLVLFAGADTTASEPIAETTLIVAPARCWYPDDGPARAWGLATQLHALRSAHNWGIGDFTDLTRLVELTAAAGADMVALSPLHALFLAAPERCDPYRPSSRRWLNPLFIDVEALPELADCADVRAYLDSGAFQAGLRALRGAELVDYRGVAAAKLDILARLFRSVRAGHNGADDERTRAFGAFRDAEGEALGRFALFQTLAEYLAEHGTGHEAEPPDEQATGPNGRQTEDESPAGGFETWPGAYRDPESPAVRDFAREHAERVEFFAWLQWLARRQLDAVAARCKALGMVHGLCLDLAVGAAPDGADRWEAPARYVADAHVGAPPDDFSPKGQDWRVLAWHPQRLREAAYAPFAAELRANMRGAGALRIDHVMGLLRLFLVPAGTAPDAATYLTYPFHDLLGVLALESVRNRCLIIGEDLGTVPDAVRAAMRDWGLLSTRVLYFERDAEGGFLPPADFPAAALVTAGTHDLPPLQGFWTGVDLERRRALGLFRTDADYAQRLLARTNDRARLLLALERAGLLPPDGGADPVALPTLTPAHLNAIQVYLARAPSQLLLVQTADLLGETEQMNLPGSSPAHPNWRRRQPLALEHWAEQPDITALLEAVAGARNEGTASTTAPTAGTAATPAPQIVGQPPLAPVIPRATYRLQLHAGFGFAAATALVPYLAALGISHVYCSPYLEARPGSTHGYDVVAHDRLNPELGSPHDYERFCAALAEHGMGQILDMVPNHVGIMGAGNAWWLDVLENGQAAEHAPFFDIDWQPLKQELHGKVLVPVLGGHYGEVLDRGELVLHVEDGAFHVAYYEHRFPIDPREYPRILAPGLPALRERLGAGNGSEPARAAASEAAEPLAAFESLVTAFGNLPPRDALDEASLAERRRDKELHKARLAELCAGSADLARYVEDCLTAYNGAEGRPADTARLHALLEAQAYRLAHWRVAADEINYRRFFDINDLAALRMEYPPTFDAVHALVLKLIGAGRIAGLRIDHPDGLYDPRAYFETLQRRAAAALAPQRHVRNDDRPLYLLAEKILVGDEQLRTDWPVHGTTGYDFATLCDALITDPDGADALTQCYHELSARDIDFADETYHAKRLVMRNMLSSELHVLASELSRIAEMDPHTRDYTLDALRTALMEVVACFPVYRTYLSARGGTDADRHQVLKAVSEARRRSPMADLSVFDFVRDVLLTDIADGKPEPYRARVLRLAIKFQQYTAPVMAKGVEDTAFYRWHRLVSLNEVGGEPRRFGLDPDAFHRACARRRAEWPNALLAGSTHDSKRSEDVRARLAVLSELPRLWCTRAQRWVLLNRRLHRIDEAGGTIPDANTEYLLYQTLVGVWPQPDTIELNDADGLQALRGRIDAYMAKAAKESKLHTAWTNADPQYEAALAAFVDAVTDPARSAAFLEDFIGFLRPVARLGLLNSLTLALLRLTAPGVPDIYQGCELWNLSLVDPDNRRPVDFDQRRALLAGLPTPAADAPADPPAWHAADGSAKLHLIRQALRLRAEAPALFAAGDYLPLAVAGPLAGHLLAFARVHEGRAAVALAPRLLAPLVLGHEPSNARHVSPDLSKAAHVDPFAHPGWETTLIDVPGRHWVDRLGGGTLDAGDGNRTCLRAADVLGRFPVGLLTTEDAGARAG